MNSGGECDFQFGADAIRARNENRTTPALAIQLKKRSEAANRRQHATPKSFSSHSRNAPLGLIRDGDIYPSIGILHVFSSAFRRDLRSFADS
jgi:hypothetical protein